MSRSSVSSMNPAETPCAAVAYTSYSRGATPSNAYWPAQAPPVARTPLSEDSLTVTAPKESHAILPPT